MFCPRCGKPIATDAAFCSFCGAATRAGATATVDEPMAAPSPWATAGQAPLAPTAYGSAPVVVAVPAVVRSAGFWIRALAYVIDAIVMLPVTWTLERIMQVDPGAPLTPATIPAFMAAACFQGIAWLVYCALLESGEWQGTVGKLALGLRVTDQEGRRISILRATLRHVAKYLSLILLGIGFLMIAFQEQKRGLHDLIAGTRVIRRRRA